jgi:FkbM family methyltransferase
MSIFADIRAAEPDFVPPCIFDIGANVGQTLAEIRQIFPDAPVHAFEPVHSTFARLEAAAAGDPAAALHRLAFASRAGRVMMEARPGNTMNRIVSGQPANRNLPLEEVEVVTGDGFCAAHGIREIGILKVDTEGHDLDVLVGFHGMLATRSIRYVEAECAISPHNRMHVPFMRIADYMFAMGYGLFGLFPAGRHPQGYANLHTRTRGRGIWYGNAVFVAEPWPEQAMPM